MARSIIRPFTDSPEPPQDNVAQVKQTDTSTTVNEISGDKTVIKKEYEVPKGETVTTTTTTGFPDLIPTLIPALQSSSYVLVILASFVAWSSRKLVTTFLERHLELMETVKVSLETERDNNEKQMAVLASLTENNKTLASALDKAITFSTK